MEELKQVLRDNHIQVTQQRLEVLRVLKELGTHVTVEDVVAALKQHDITLTLASVYNILGIFEKKGLIMKIGTAGEPVIFDVNTFPHFHLCAAPDAAARYVAKCAEYDFQKKKGSL